MSAVSIMHRIDQAHGSSEGWLMYLARLLGDRLARPRFLHPGELSPHLLRDIGLGDEAQSRLRPRP